eukprot:UN14299
MRKVVTESLTDDDVSELISSAETDFGLFPGTVTAEVEYEITGTIDVKLYGSDYIEEELVDALEESIADALNIHVSDVEVVFDPESGEAMYTITSDSVDDALTLQEQLLRHYDK